MRYRPIRKEATINADANIRTGPSLSAPVHFHTTDKMVRFIDGEVPGQSYNGSTRWLTFWANRPDTTDRYDGKWVYVHRSVVTF